MNQPLHGEGWARMWYVNRNHVTSFLGEGAIFHRKNGPAVERTNGAKEWWTDGDLIKVSDGRNSSYSNMHHSDRTNVYLAYVVFEEEF